MAAWLAELAWPAVVGVMALALGIAWLVEWVSWRDAQARAAAPLLDRRHVVEEAQPHHPEPAPEPAAEPPSVVETAPDPLAPEPEPEPEPAPLPPEALEAPESVAPEPVEESAPEPVEPVAEPEPDESFSEPLSDETPEPEASDPPVPRVRRAWRGMSFRRVDPPEAATTPGEPASAGGDPIELPEPPPAAASEPEPRPAYAPPRAAPPLPAPEPAPVVPRMPAKVARMPRSAVPREWNVWELESLAREQARLEPERGEEWSYLFVHLRQFADAQGKLPSEFDGLVRESFGELLVTLEPA